MSSFFWSTFGYGTPFFLGFITSSALRALGNQKSKDSVEKIVVRDKNVIIIDTTKPLPKKGLLNKLLEDGNDDEREGYIKQKTYQVFINKYREADPNEPLHVLVSTIGGDLTSSLAIARVLHRHPSPVYVYVPKYACSGGTLISLVADRIFLDPYAYLSPIDPQMVLPMFTFSLKNLRKTISEVCGDNPAENPIANYMDKEAGDVIRGYMSKFNKMMEKKHNAATIKKIDKELFNNEVNHSSVMFAEELDFLPIESMTAKEMKNLLFRKVKNVSGNKRKRDQDLDESYSQTFDHAKSGNSSNSSSSRKRHRNK